MLVGGVRQLHHLSVLNLQEEKPIQDLGDTVGFKIAEIFGSIMYHDLYLTTAGPRTFEF
jgi:hypothetical protein